MDHGRLAAFLVSEILVARAHGETVRCANRRGRDDGDRHAEIGHHPPDDGELLEVLLAEYGYVRLHYMEELCNDGRDALEVAGTELTVENARESRHLDARGSLRAVGIYLDNVRHEHQVAARVGQHSGVLRWRARIMREVLVGTELHRIDEDAGDKTIPVAARQLDQAYVPGVEIAHGGDEGDAPSLAAPAPHALAHAGNSGDGLHDSQKQCSGAGYAPVRTAST